MKLSDLFKSRQKDKSIEKESESVESSREDQKIFQDSDSYTSILEQIDEDIQNVETKNLEDTSSQVDSFSKSSTNFSNNTNSSNVEESSKSERLSSTETQQNTSDSLESEKTESLTEMFKKIMDSKQSSSEDLEEPILEETLSEDNKEIKSDSVVDEPIENVEERIEVESEQTVDRPIRHSRGRRMTLFNTESFVNEEVESEDLTEKNETFDTESLTSIIEEVSEIVETGETSESEEFAEIEEKDLSVETPDIGEKNSPELELSSETEEINTEKMSSKLESSFQSEVESFETEAKIISDDEIKESLEERSIYSEYKDYILSLNEEEPESQEEILEIYNENSKNVIDQDDDWIDSYLEFTTPLDEINEVLGLIEENEEQTEGVTEEVESREALEEIEEPTFYLVPISENPLDIQREKSITERLEQIEIKKEIKTPEGTQEETISVQEVERVEKSAKKEKRSILDRIRGLRKRKKELTTESEQVKTETAQERTQVETKPEKEPPKRKISVSNIFKRHRKKEEEEVDNQLTAPLDSILEKARQEIKPVRSEEVKEKATTFEEGVQTQTTQKPRRRTRRGRSELLISKAVKEETVSEETLQKSPKPVDVTIEFEKLDLTELTSEEKLERESAGVSPTIPFKISPEEKKEAKSTTANLLKELEAEPVLDENLRRSLELERKQAEAETPRESTANTRRKEVQRQLRRQKNAEKEQQKSKTKELTQNLKSSSKKEQSLIFAKVPDNILKGGVLLFNNLAKQMDRAGSLRIESLMSVLGSLAGYSIQAGIREKMVKRLRLSEEQVFSIVETKDEQRYFFGDPVDRLLQKDKSSLWYMVASATQRLSGKVDTNIDETMRYTIRNIGKESFGIPRLPKNHRPNHTPQYYVEHMWEALVPGLERFTQDPLQWPLVFSVALQRALICTQNILDPNISLKIITESAVPMAVADIKPIPTTQVTEEKVINMDVLREQIEALRKALESNLSPEQRAVLLRELSLKTEILYDAMEKRSAPQTERTKPKNL